MKDRGKKVQSVQVRMSQKMYEALIKISDQRECSLPEALRYAAKKFYKISYQK